MVPPPEVPFSRSDGARMEEAVRALLFVLDVSRPSAGRDALREHLRQTRQLLTIVRESPIVLPRTSSAEAILAVSLDGVIELPQSGRSNVFLDARLRRFYRL